MLLCKRVLALILGYSISEGACQCQTLQQQLDTVSTTSHRWVIDMLPKGKKLRPLVSEFQSYRFFLVAPSQEPENSKYFQLQLKGSRLVQRQLQWGKMRVVLEGNQRKFLWIHGKDGKTFELDGEAAVLDDVQPDLEVQA